MYLMQKFLEEFFSVPQCSCLFLIVFLHVLIKMFAIVSNKIYSMMKAFYIVREISICLILYYELMKLVTFLFCVL